MARKPIEVQNHDKKQGFFYTKMSEVSDGYHTFDELYKYRMLYHANWVNELYDNGFQHISDEAVAHWDLHKSRKHSDGEDCFGGGWFIVSITLPTGQVSNHYPDEYWDFFRIDSRKKASKWDGHTPEEAAQRLEDYIMGRWN